MQKQVAHHLITYYKDYDIFLEIGENDNRNKVKLVDIYLQKRK